MALGSALQLKLAPAPVCPQKMALESALQLVLAPSRVNLHKPYMCPVQV